MIIDCISDLHGHYPELEGGDLLIIAGDMTAHDKIPEWFIFFDWLEKQKYRKKIYIGGNHDNFLVHCIAFNDPKHKWLSDLIEEETGNPKGANIEYLKDTGTEFEGLKIWGSPWTAWFAGINSKCEAFVLNGESFLKKKWDLIPKDVDILITHSPPFGHLDRVYNGQIGKWMHCGSMTLAQIDCDPKLWVFGHIHEGYGQKEEEECKYVNASIMNEYYEPVNKPIRIIL
jgi:Icc-related predicted phosphoesterase